MTDLDNFRAEKDQFFSTDRQSPLTVEQKLHFNGISYFPEDLALVFEVTVEEFDPRLSVKMQTSTGKIQVYERYGKISFIVDGQDVELTVYANLEGGYFLPFVDALAGHETYGAGRYVEPQPLEGGRFLVDFNLSYNPYCAFNDGWSCPLTPAENRLNVPIRPGEKLFQQAIH
jgi:uncharacterized protein (DUF1684 family)